MHQGLRAVLLTLASLTPAGVVGLGCAHSGPLSFGGSSDDTPPAFGDRPSSTCVNLQCNQVSCANGATTSVSGTILSPAGASGDPIYNVIVFVPNSPVLPFHESLDCDQCGTIASGTPLVTALSQADGRFTLANAPVGNDIPLVIQVGRWRRQVTIPTV